MNEPNWHKSSHSASSDNTCVEVADIFPVVLVRDTKDHGRGILTVSQEAWANFLDHTKTP
ncbi:DUF397 domain-containing protein [Streptomyces sp. NPDC048172]|uniref:DUF397 domain-containing protein n=1 Tax=Streptomyces sp. NPDC048172 TaxID=3365505 RepID=UPI003718BD18